MSFLAVLRPPVKWISYPRMASPHTDIDSTLREYRSFAPPAAFAKAAVVKDLEGYRRLYEEADRDPEGFWATQARERLKWRTPFTTVLEWKPPFARWFLGGQLNLTETCLDQHLVGPRRNKPALIWEGEPGDSRTLTSLGSDGERRTLKRS